jgi:NADPH-dependent curcumin reductase
MPISRRVVLTARPDGIPQAQHFRIETADTPALKSGEILVRNQFLSVEPAMRGWVSAVANYAQPVGIGEVMRSFASGEVMASEVTGMFGWQELAVVPASAVSRKVTETDLPLSASLGVMGLNGLTAYFGFLDVGSPKPGDTLVVSTAAGSVGSAVGQIAKLMGCRTVGIAGGAAKVQQCLDEFGYDAAIDYKVTNDIAGAVAEACPGGVDVYFDNTSGAISDAVMKNLAMGARIVICGTASVSSWDPWPSGPRPERHILVKRARMAGVLLFDYAHRYPEGLARLAGWIREGKIRYAEDILEGIEAAPDAIASLYRGENRGKRLIRLHG